VIELGVIKLRFFPEAELDIAEFTDIVPVLCKVAKGLLLIWVWIEDGLTFEVLALPVYQVPEAHSPVGSKVAVETVIADGILLVFTDSTKFWNPGAE
jgi:hypothetical protein